ncbi:MAG: helix-turn-helix domain-containing protein [Thermodesulfobacteriota bacterium]
MKSQEKQILQYLKTGAKITPLEALNRFGCFRLGARCWNLKQAGYNIKTEMITCDGKRFAEYSLINAEANGQLKLF